VWLNGLGRTPSCFTAHEFDGSRVQTPGADAVRPAGVSKLVAISMQWVTAVEDCKGKGWGCKMAGLWTMQQEAQTTIRWFPAVRTGALKMALAVTSAPNKSITLTF
jgi:hypothetical protein